MSKDLNAQWLGALAAQGITTAYLVRLDFASETAFIWTGEYPIEPNNTGDALLDGNTFQPFMSGTPYDVGTNTYSEQGSDALELTLAVPADLPPELVSASIDSNEYLSRPATVWRALMISQAGLATPAVWMFRRIRSGSMDTLEFTTDSTQSVVKLTIESHASYISAASNSTYIDQKKYDPNDTSQDYMSSSVNGQPIANTYNHSAAFSLYNNLFNKGRALD
jgi:hypothetical protein